MIHNTSAYLFGFNRMEVLFKCGSEFVIIRFREYRCTRARNKVGTLSGNNVEVVLQVRAAVSSTCRNTKGCGLTIGGSWRVASVLSSRDVMASDG
jgi:hypothetical protein